MIKRGTKQLARIILKNITMDYDMSSAGNALKRHCYLHFFIFNFFGGDTYQ